MADVRRTLAYSALQSYVSVGVQLISTALLSRILTPAEVGVYAVAAVFSAVATNVRDFGIAEYLIQVQELTVTRIRAALAVNIISSWTMALALFAASGPAGEFYLSPEITSVMQVQSCSLLLIPFGAINMAWFRREMNFKPILFCSLGADSIALIVSVVLALRGKGAMSLAWSSLSGIVVTVVVSMALRPKHFPRWPGLRGIGEAVRFGGFASVLYGTAQLGRGAPEMILGRLLGVSSVAMFSRGGGPVQMFRLVVSRAAVPVCMPYFAKAVREEGSVSRAYVRATSLFTAIGFTALGFLSLGAFPLIRIIYGAQWDAAVPLARVLCIAAAIDLVHYLGKEALLSNGTVKIATRLQVYQQVIQVLGLLLAFPFGLIGACWGMLASAIVGVALSQWQLHEGTGFMVSQTRESCAGGLLVAVLALIPMVVLDLVMPANAGNYLRQILLGSLLTTTAWLFAVRWTRHPVWFELLRAAAPLRARLAQRARRSP